MKELFLKVATNIGIRQPSDRELLDKNWKNFTEELEKDQHCGTHKWFRKWTNKIPKLYEIGFVLDSKQEENAIKGKFILKNTFTDQVDSFHFLAIVTDAYNNELDIPDGHKTTVIYMLHHDFPRHISDMSGIWDMINFLKGEAKERLCIENALKLRL